MAAENSTENFQGRASFFVLGDFGMIFFFFFFKMSSIRFSFRIWNWFFSRFGLWHPKTGPKSKKWVRKQSNDTKQIVPKVGTKVQTLRTFFVCKNSKFSNSIVCHVDTYKEQLWSKFQLNRTIITGVIAQKPSNLGPIGSRSKRNQGYPKGKVNNGKYPEVKTCGSREYGRMFLLQTM